MSGRHLRTVFTLARPVAMPTETAGALLLVASVSLLWSLGGAGEVGGVEGVFAVLLGNGLVRVLPGQPLHAGQTCR